MRAFDPEVVDTVWAGIEPLLPPHPETHPLGCHRKRASDRVCFEVLLVRLVTGCSFEDAEHLCSDRVSDTTVRARRDEWVEAGVFDRIVEEAICAYDKIIGLDLSEVAVDGSIHKAPGGGEGTGPNPTDRGRPGWKWSIATEAAGIPVGWTSAGAQRHDSVLLEPTLQAVGHRGLLEDVETVHLDRGYDSAVTRERLGRLGITDALIGQRRKAGTATSKRAVPLGLRWPVERTNSWLSNFGQLRRNTDRKLDHRLAQFALAVVFLITAKLIDWRNRWCPGVVPIR
jgi:transposase